MPKYIYKCKDCNNKFNIEASIKEKEEGGNRFNCPKCKSKNTKQVFSLKSFFSKDKESGDGCCCSGKCK
jgi:putative FmdB family regulatory protein